MTRQLAVERRRNSRLRYVALALALLIGSHASAVSAQHAKRLLILPFDMVDSSLQGDMNHGPLEADVARLQRTEAVVHRALDEQPDFNVIRDAPVADRIRDAQRTYRYLYACNGCETDLGKAADADLVMTGWVQKVSNLIININAALYDVETGATVGGASVDMRGNTDTAWRDAALYLVQHSLLDNYHARRKTSGHGPQ